jgi:tetratricopeptide (TPR) repeat protein
LAILEETYENQVKKLRGDESHPFLEQCISQMGLLQKVTGQSEKAEESYKRLVRIKENYYGETSESLVISLKNLGAVQVAQDKYEEAQQTLNRAVDILEKLVDGNKIKDKQSMKQHGSEVIFLI